MRIFSLFAKQLHTPISSACLVTTLHSITLQSSQWHVLIVSTATFKWALYLSYPFQVSLFIRENRFNAYPFKSTFIQVNGGDGDIWHIQRQKMRRYGNLERIHRNKYILHAHFLFVDFVNNKILKYTLKSYGPVWCIFPACSYLCLQLLPYYAVWCTFYALCTPKIQKTAHFVFLHRRICQCLLLCKP